MTRLLPTFALAATLAVLTIGAAPAEARIGLAQAHGFTPHQVVVKFDGEPTARKLRLPDGVGVRERVAALRKNPAVEYAEPNYVATASVAGSSSFVIPDDPGTLEGPAEAAASPGGWA